MCTSNAPTSMIEQGVVSLSCLPMRARAGGRRHAEGCKYRIGKRTSVLQCDHLLPLASTNGTPGPCTACWPPPLNQQGLTFLRSFSCAWEGLWIPSLFSFLRASSHNFIGAIGKAPAFKTGSCLWSCAT